MEKSDIIQIINELTSENDPNENSKVNNFDEILNEKSTLIRRKYEKFCENIENYDEINNASVSYTILLAESLNNLRNILDKSNSKSEEIFISVKDLTAILRGTEFLVAVGVRPCLDVEIGQIRTNSNKIRVDLTSETKEILLDESLTCLLNLCTCETIQSSIISKYLNFIIVGCLQMTRNPNSPVTVEKYRRKLENLFNFVFRPFVLRELMILQRIPSCPAWIKIACSKYLSRFLLETNGLFHFLTVTKDLGSNFDDHRCCESLAKLLVTPSKSYKNRVQEYYENICEQFWTVYHSTRQRSTSEPNDYGSFFYFVAKKLLSVDEKTFRRLFLKRLQLPLVECESDSANYPSDKILTDCIECCHYFLCNGPSETDFVLNFIDFAPLFASIYADLDGSASFCAILTKEIVVRLFQSLEPSVFVDVSKYFLRQSKNFRQFYVSANGGVGVRNDPNSTQNESETKILILIRILDILPNEIQSKFACEIVVDCLKRMSFAQKDFLFVDQPSTSTTDFVMVDEKIRLIEENLTNLTLLSALIDRFGENLTRDSEKIFDLCDVIFENNSNSNEDVPNELKDQTMLTCFGLISLIILNPDETAINSIENCLPKLLDRLKILSEVYPNEEIRETAKNMLSSVDVSDVKSSEMSKKPNKNESDSKKQPWQPKNPSYDEALVDINDSLLPVRAHGIIAMTSLLKLRDPQAVSNVEFLLTIFLENVENEDSYVFLPAVNAITVVAELKTKTALDSLLQKFVDYGQRKEQSSIENQLKIGEAMIKVVRILGDVAPHYFTQTVNTFLSMMKCNDENVRASCLSNIGEISMLSSYKISNILHEIIFAIEQLLKMDKSSIVRRAAVNLLRNILVGSSHRMLEIFGDEMIKIYRLLKTLYVDDDDDVVRLHAQICLEMIEEHMKDISSPSIVGNLCIRNIQI